MKCLANSKSTVIFPLDVWYNMSIKSVKRTIGSSTYFLIKVKKVSL